MSKYIKYFDKHTDYETYINGNDKILPNVSYCFDNNEVHYNDIYSKELFLRSRESIINDFLKKYQNDKPFYKINSAYTWFLVDKYGRIITNNLHIYYTTQFIGYQYDSENDEYLYPNTQRTIEVGDFTAITIKNIQEYSNNYPAITFSANNFQESDFIINALCQYENLEDPTGLTYTYSSGKSQTTIPAEWATFTFTINNVTYTSTQLNSGEIKIREWKYTDAL